MSLKALILSNLYWIAILFVSVSGCSTLQTRTNTSASDSGDQRTFALAEQKIPPQEIQSLRLYPKKQPGMPPVITLNSDQQLTLSFDYLSEQNRQFRIEISHRTREWTESNIPPSTYMESFFKTYIQKSKQSTANDPAYQHVEYHFPNENLRPKVSGNYLLEVYGYQNNELLFSMPFFITEDQGTVQIRVETLFAQRKDSRSLAQLFSTYRYPSFVEYPQFDLSISYVQNQFWGRMQSADYTNTSTPGALTGHINRDNAFIADYAFKLLDMQTFNANGRQILEFNPGTTPSTIILRRDVQYLDVNPRFFPGQDIGFALSDRNSRYARVAFSLSTDSLVASTEDIYIVGDFNNWMISDYNKMQFNASSGLWEGTALVKQGKYAYKYVQVKDNIVDDLSLDQSFLSGQQEYLTFIYFTDPDQKFNRLLKVNRTIQR